MTPRLDRFAIATVAALAVLVCARAHAKPDWTTPAERSGFATTPRYAETRAWLERLAAAAPDRLRLTRFGVSPEGRDLMLVVATSGGEFSPEAARASGKDIVLVQSGIHAGEIEGKDAGLMLLRDLAFDAKKRRLLDHAIVLYLPIFNVDGHEQFGAYNRINQNGPAEMGFRATAKNLNLNRDYMKADAPEMRDWLTLFDAWSPDLFIDVHTTNGADYQYDLTWYLEEWAPLDAGLKQWQTRDFKQTILPAFERKRHLAAPYIELVDHRDLAKGIGNFGSGPRYSTGYVALRNRVGLLVETHMLKPYATRVRATYDLLVTTLEHLARHPGALHALGQNADAAMLARGAGAEVPIAFKTSEHSVPFAFKGYATKTVKSPVSGDDWVTYDPTKPKLWTIPAFRDLVASESITTPAAYALLPGWPDIATKLGEHGLRSHRLAQALEVDAEHDRLSAPKWSQRPFEGRRLLGAFDQRRTRARTTLPAGTIIVALDQPAANVAVGLLEPKAADSLLRWGFFDTIFEQKEYADARVAERLAADMLAKDPALKAEFEARLTSDAEFAKSPGARLAFFYERSPWYAAQRMGAYPVLRLDAVALARVREAH